MGDGRRKVVLVTGAAGFIGNHLAARLLRDGTPVVGVDNLNEYYDPTLKQDRLSRVVGGPEFEFERVDVSDRVAMSRVFSGRSFSCVVHLAAQAGVRYSIENPHSYVDSNLVGFLNILEGCREHDVPHLVYASSSSVYGANLKVPFSVDDSVDHPVSLYAATKRANELMAHTYSHLYGLPTTGLRFFTVYGPWGRPDMAMFSFTRRILAGEPIDVYNYGDHQRDFTYIDDIVEGVVRVMGRPAVPDPAWDPMSPDKATSAAPWRVYNIGNNRPEELMELIAILERALGRTAEKRMLPMQPGDVQATYADVDALERDFGFRPRTSLEDGVARFVQWYRGYYGV